MRTGASRLSGIPIISLDLCYTKAGEVDRNPQPLDRGQEDGEMVIDLYEEEEAKEAEELRIESSNQPYVDHGGQPNRSSWFGPH